MPFERLSLPDGVKLPSMDPEVLPRSVYAIGVIYVRKFITLVPGEYDLTPKVWQHNTHTHHLTVHDNDTATYRMLPKFSDSGTLSSEDFDEFVPGGAIHKIPEDRSTVVVLGGATDGVRLYELIQHVAKDSS